MDFLSNEKMRVKKKLNNNFVRKIHNIIDYEALSNIEGYSSNKNKNTSINI